MDWDEIRYFKRSEFGVGEPGVQPDERLVRLLDEARAVAGVPFKITSGLRSRERNKQVGGADTSAHLTGHAVDIRCPTSRHRFLMLQALLEVGFERIGVYPAHLHVDTSPSSPAAVIWTG